MHAAHVENRLTNPSTNLPMCFYMLASFRMLPKKGQKAPAIVIRVRKRHDKSKKGR
jgi:hypothetical protein